MTKIQPENGEGEKYISCLLELKLAMLNMAPQVQDAIWLESFKKSYENGPSRDNLPILLALIHPDFYMKGEVHLGRDLGWSNNPNFSAGILTTDRCQSHEYTGVPCAFNNHPSIRGKCQADHRWPSSLGGPSTIENRLLLCKYHNSMKSNEISHYSWNHVPIWLDGYIRKLKNLKY